MAAHDYEFVTHWRAPSRVEDVFDVLSDSAALSRWWPSVYLDVREIKPGDERGIGRKLALHTKGWLPYTLKWTLNVLEIESPHHLVIGASGDFNGRGEWILEQSGDFVNVTFDWRIAAEKPLLKHLSLILKPIFALNHEWAMRRGEESLLLELQRRCAASSFERDTVAAPPGPSRCDARVAAVIAVCCVIVGSIVLLRQRRK